MTETTGVTVPLHERLTRIGDPRDTLDWPDGEPDYVSLLDLGPESVPDLIRIARGFLDIDRSPDAEDSDDWMVPIHAWRALAQLRAAPAVEPLLQMMDPLSAALDDWYLEEFPDVFALIGPPVLGMVAEYLANDSHDESARICASDGIRRIAERHPDMRDEAVRYLTDCLREPEREAAELNAFLVGNLLELNAAESAEVIERAYAAGSVAEDLDGDWEHVRTRLGVEGLGLVPKTSSRRRATFAAWTGADASSRTYKSRTREKEKKKRRARKQGRKRRR